MPTGAEFDVECFAIGDDVYGDKVWDYGTNKQTGYKGYAADKYIDTQDTQGNEPEQLKAQGIEECGSSQAQASIPVNPEYNQWAAVKWAKDHAMDEQDHDEECAWFVSQALWAGGLPQSEQWRDTSGYWSGNPLHLKAPTYFSGTKIANTVTDLIQYLRQNLSTKWIFLGSMNAGNNDVPVAQPGDIIAYNWDGRGSIDHLAFVVGFAGVDTTYPLVAEWGQSKFIVTPANPYRSLYVERGWTWSVVDNTWLQNEPNNHNMTAYLLHFNGGIMVSNF